MSNESIVQEFLSAPSNKSVLPRLKEKLETMNKKDGALLLFQWVSNTIELINANELEVKEKRFSELFKVMKFIDKKYPEVLELEDPVPKEGQEIQKLLVRFLKMRRDRLSLNFKKINEAESLIKKFGVWDFKQTLEKWAQKDVFLETHEREILLQAAFSVDTRAELFCIQKWWNPQEEIEKNLYFTASHAVNFKYVEVFANLLNQNQSSPLVSHDFYSQTDVNAWVGFIQTQMDYEQSSIAYILRNACPQLGWNPQMQTSFGATLYVLANNLEAWTLIKDEDMKKITQDILWGAARIDYQEAQNAIEEVFHYVKKRGNNQLDLVPYVLEKEKGSQGIDFMLGLELSDYLDQNDIEEVGGHKLIQYVEKIKHKSPSLFYFISKACEETEMEKIQTVKKILDHSQEHAADWKEKLGVDLKAKDLSQWSERIIEMVDTNYLDEERISLVFEELNYLNRENNAVCSWINAIFEQQEDLTELSEKIQDEPLETEEKNEIAKMFETIGRPDLGEAFKNLMLNHELQTRVKKVKAPKKMKNELNPNRF